MDEVGTPTILATFTVIAAILPMAFVRGLMGPYMRPIPVGAAAAMLFSLIVAFVVSPWSALRLLHHYAERPSDEHEAQGWSTKLYRRIMNPLIASSRRRWMFLGGMVVLLLLACSLVAFKLVMVTHRRIPESKRHSFRPTRRKLPEADSARYNVAAVVGIPRELTFRGSAREFIAGAFITEGPIPGVASTLPGKIINSQKLRNGLLLAISVLVFLFVLQAKTAVYNGTAQAKVTPTTASKLWLDGHKWESPSVRSTTAILFWMVSLFLLALYRKPEWRAHSVLQRVHPRLSSHQYLQRFLRPPPIV